MSTAIREVQHGAVFRDDDVEAREVAGDALQVVEPPAGHEGDENAALTCGADRPPLCGFEDPVSGDGAVIVEISADNFIGPLPCPDCPTVGNPCRVLAMGSAAARRLPYAGLELSMMGVQTLAGAVLAMAFVLAIVCIAFLAIKVQFRG
jgi:hypothetical protein